jgi:hypothetical protein
VGDGAPREAAGALACVVFAAVADECAGAAACAGFAAAAWAGRAEAVRVAAAGVGCAGFAAAAAGFGDAATVAGAGACPAPGRDAESSGPAIGGIGAISGPTANAGKASTAAWRDAAMLWV